ncbi:MAG: hypothetical protein ACI4NM_05770 [Bullifex sp.]
MEEIRNKSFKEGESSGISKRNKDIAIKMHDMGDPVGKIALAVEVSEDQVREWISQLK